MIVLSILVIYLTCGFLFAIPFLIRWIKVIDEGSHDTSLMFKLTILPGVIVFWPALLSRYLKRQKSTDHD